LLNYSDYPRPPQESAQSFQGALSRSIDTAAHLTVETISENSTRTFANFYRGILDLFYIWAVLGNVKVAGVPVLENTYDRPKTTDKGS
jgi:hypothetical protein